MTVEDPRASAPPVSAATRPQLVVPVLGAAAGVGTTTVACALADAAATGGLTAAVIDLAPPYRSGLTAAAEDGPVYPSGDEALALRAGTRRSGAHLVRMETHDRTLRDAYLGRHRLPEPGWWYAAAGGAQLLVVDVAWDGVEELGGHGPTVAWLTHPPAPVRPVLVVPPTGPGASRAEAVLAALERYGTPPPAVALSRTRRGDAALRRSAGQRLTQLLPSAVAVPADGHVAANGVTATELPAAVTAAARHLLETVGAIPAGSTSRRGRKVR